MDDVGRFQVMLQKSPAAEAAQVPDDQAQRMAIVGHLTGDSDARMLTVSLFATEDGSVKWTESYPVTSAETSAVADQIAGKADEVLPRREGRGPPKP